MVSGVVAVGVLLAAALHAARPTPTPTATASDSRRSVASRMCERYAAYVFREEEAFLILDASNQSVTVDTCAKSSEPLIVGGDAVRPGEFPHLSLVGYGNESDIQYLCGGALIAPSFVLTAAHCLITQSGQRARWVLLGDLDISSTQDDAQPQRIEVAEAIKHPDYKPPQKYNDIALLRLQSSAQMTGYVRPACLNTNRTFPSSRGLTATCWDRDRLTDDSGSAKMKRVATVQPHRACNESHRSAVGVELPRGILDDTQLCASDLAGGKDTCQGQNGGQLQIFTIEKPFYCMDHVVGVASLGKALGVPTVYTRVSAFVPWIESVVWPGQQ